MCHIPACPWHFPLPNIYMCVFICIHRFIQSSRSNCFTWKIYIPSVYQSLHRISSATLRALAIRPCLHRPHLHPSLVFLKWFLFLQVFRGRRFIIICCFVCRSQEHRPRQFSRKKLRNEVEGSCMIWQSLKKAKIWIYRTLQRKSRDRFEQARVLMGRHEISAKD